MGKGDSNVPERIRPLKLMNCGLVSGLLQAAVFNPWDRALYLSVKNERVFLHAENFRSPMAGVTQTITQRTISAGSYFPLEDIFRKLMFRSTPKDSRWRPWVTFLAGNIAGALNGLLMNPISSIKYHYWGKTECGKETFYTTARDMFQRGGFKPFFVGSTATIGRDLVFGGFFALFRHELFSRTKSSSAGSSSSKQPGDKFLVNLFAASAATILSSPLNYVRNIHYATPPDVKPDTFWKIFSDLVCNALREPTLLQKLSYIQSRYRIGWGTARVGCGMAFGSYIYNQCAQTEIYTSK